MGNPIKYSSTVTSGSYNKGNIAVGTNTIGFGPTSTTGWYNSVTPTGGNFIVTEVVDGNTPPRFYAPSTEAEWIRLAKQEGATGVNTGSALAVRNWFASQANYIVTNIDFPTSMPTIVGDGLVLNLDAKINSSYPGSGTSWNDISGLGNNGTLTNGPTFNSGLGAIIFDGTNDYVQVTSPFGDIDWSTKAWSFCAFMKLDTLGDKCLVNLNSANSSHYIVTNVFYTDGKSYWYFIKNSLSIQTNFTQTTSNFTTNTAFHFTMTYNGNGLSNNNIKFYKNGELLTTTEGGSAGLSNQSGLQIGGNYPLDGNVYDFLMYDKVLTQTEVKQNYYQSNIVIDGLIYAIDPSNPSSYESGSTTTYSLTGSVNGTLINGTGYNTTNSGIWTFDGVDDYMITQTITGYKSLCFWVYWDDTGPAGIWKYLLDARSGMNAGWFVPSAGSQGSDWNSTFYVNSIALSGCNTTNVPINRWNHIYLEGVGASYTSTINFMSRYSNNEQAGGKIGGIYVYNRALTAAEISQNFNAQRSRFGI